jgi:heptosyltransferase III
MPHSAGSINQSKLSGANPRIIISRTDNIGDVVLALPMASAIKKAIPAAYILFLGKPYTKDIIKMSPSVDEFVDWEKIKNLSAAEQINTFKKLHADYIIHAFPVKQIARLSKKAGIPNRVGATGRTYQWYNCNKLVLLSRKRSNLHEAQLNLKLLKPLHIQCDYTIDEVIAKFDLSPPVMPDDKWVALIDKDKFNLILHPKSKGSAREWPMGHYSQLISLLPADKFKIFITGTAADSEAIQKFIISKHTSVTDLSGKLSLSEFICFISKAGGMLACSTGPLHIAAALGKVAVGIYPPIKPMHSGRWSPLGKNASYLVLDKECSKCRNSGKCECIESITPEDVKKRLMEVFTQICR